MSNTAAISVSNGTARLIPYRPYYVQNSESQFTAGTHSSTEVKTDLIPDTVSGVKTTDTGLVGYWPMNESSGGTVQDLKSGFDGTITGGGTWTTGKFGSALTAAAGVSIADDPAMNLTTTFTISAWIKPSNSHAANIFRFSSTSPGFLQFDYSFSNGKLMASINGGSTYLGNSTLTYNKWYHVAMVKSGDTGSNVTFYVNGVADGTAAIGSLAVPSGSKQIAWTGANYVVDDVALYNRALSAAELLEQSAAGAAVHMLPAASMPPQSPKLSGREHGLGAYFPFDDSSTTITPNLANSSPGLLANVVSGDRIAGVNGRAIACSGAANRTITIAHHPLINPIGNSLSLSFWFKQTGSNATANYMSKRQLGIDGYQVYWYGSGTSLVFAKEGLSAAVGTTAGLLNDGNWHHVAFTAGAGGMKVYVDGVLNNTTANTENFIPSTSDLLITVRSDNLPAFDELSIWNRELKTSEIERLAGKKGQTASYLTQTMDGEIASAKWDKIQSTTRSTPGMEFILWRPYETHASGGRSVSVALGDLDADGTLDSVEGNEAAVAGIHAVFNKSGNGYQRYSTITTVSTDSTAADIAITDFNSDGALDFATADFTAGGVKWYRSDGATTPSFTQATVLATAASEAQTVAVGDFNSDRYPDIVAGFTGALDKISWFSNDGATTPAFTENVLQLSFSGRAVAAGDLNGDGVDDVAAVSAEANTVTWFKNSGGSSPTFTRDDLHTTFTGVNSVAIADVDSDGDNDIIASTPSAIGWFQNGGGTNPSFSFVAVGETIGSNLKQTIAADLNDDGIMDIVGTVDGGNLYYYQNDGNQSFTESTLSEAGGLAGGQLAAGDMNQDGWLDLVTPQVTATGFSEPVRVFLNTPWKHVATASPLSYDQPRVEALADVDNDGYLDLLLAIDSDEDEITWWKGNGDGSFTETATILGSTDGAKYAEFADVDFDGKVDVVAYIAGTQELAWWKQGANPSTWTKTVIASVAAGGKPAVADLDGDGKTDVAMTSDGAVDEIAYWHDDDSDGTWTKVSVDTMNTLDPDSLFIVDLDGDGYLDLLASGGPTADAYAWYQNSPNTFTQEQMVSTSAEYAPSRATGDLDGDGRLDLVVTRYQYLGWHRQTAARTFGTENTIVPPGGYMGRVYAVRDMDADGDLDIVRYQDDSNGVQGHIFENDGTPLDGGWVTHQVTANMEATFGGMLVGDLNNDGLLDIVSAGYHDPFAALQQPHSRVKLQARTAPATSFLSPNDVSVGYDNTANTHLASGAFIPPGRDSKRYAQVKTSFYRNSTTLDPMVKRLRTDYRSTQYSTVSPYVQTTGGQAFNYLTSFAETATKPAGTAIQYQLSPDGGNNWYYYNSGWTASNGTYAQSSPAVTLDTNIATFDNQAYADGRLADATPGLLTYRAFLNSDGTSPPLLDQVDVGYEAASVTVTAPNGGEVLKIGAPQNITFSSTGTVPSDLTLEYSTTDFVGSTAIDTGVSATNHNEEKIPGAVAVWHFDNASSGSLTPNTTTTPDSKGTNTLTASSGSGMTWAPGKFGVGALQLTGAAGEYMTKTSATGLPYNTLTLSFWWKPNATTGSVVRLNNGSLAISVAATGHVGWSGGWLYPTYPLTADGNWHHIVVTNDAANNTSRVYLDGGLQASYNAMNGSPNSTTTVEIGGFSGGSVTGTIDEVAIFNRVLTASEIAFLRSNGAGYAWTVPNDPSNSVKVRARSVSAPNIRDTSNANFSIADLNITAPDGGEFLKIQSPYNVTWSTAGPVPNDLTLEYSADGGTTFTNTIVTGLNAGAGSYSWTVPNTNSLSVRVRARSVSAPNLTDMSNANLTISDINVASPNGGEVWKVGKPHAILWTPRWYIPNDLTLEYSTDNFSSSTSIATNLSPHHHNENVISGVMGVWRMNTSTGNVSTAANAITDELGLHHGTFNNANGSVSPTTSWTTGKFGGGSGSSVGGILFDGVDDYISMSAFTAPTSYTISAWVKLTNGGKAQTIAEFDQAVMGGLFRVYTNNKLTNDNGTSFGAATLSTNTWYHVAQTYDATTTTLKFYVNGSLDGRFSVKLTPQTAFTIGKYAGGSGSYLDGALDEVAVFNRALSQDEIALLASNNAGYLWTVANAPSASAKVRARSASAPLLTDDSDANFTIADLNITSPNGGEYWEIGGTYAITWSATAAVPNDLTFEYSFDNGASWVGTPIAAGVASAAGTQFWTIPDTATGAALVRIRSVSATDLADVSNAVFALSDLAVTSPNGGELWRTGTNHDITWTTKGPVPNDLLLEYSTNGGVAWAGTPIASNQAAYPLEENFQGAVSAWHLDAASSGSIANGAGGFTDSKSTNHGTASNANGTGMAWTTGRHGQGAVVFDGVDDRINMTSVSGMPNLNGPFTLSVWVNPSNIVSQGVLALAGPGGATTLQANGMLRDNDGSVIVSGAAPSIGSWSHLVATNDGATVRYYLNGALAGTGSVSPMDTGATTIVRIGVYGSNSGSSCFSGMIDEPAIFNRALSASEITALYTKGAGKFTWNVPVGAISNQAQVRVRSLAANDIRDTTDTNYSVATLDLTAPNGGQTLYMGSTANNITWNAAGTALPSDFVLEYTTDGTNWNPVTGATGITATGTSSFNWNPVPALGGGTNMTVKVRIRSVGTAAWVDPSDADFTIRVPKLTFTAPVLNQVVPFGANFNITWTHNAAVEGTFSNDKKIQYSLDGGATWPPSQVIVQDQADNGGNPVTSPFTWAVPNTAVSNTVVLRITDNQPPYGTVDSAVFKVTGTLAVTSPDNGEKWAAGLPHQVTWVRNGSIANVNLFAYDATVGPGTPVATIGTNVNAAIGATGITWTPPAGIANTNLKVRVEDATDPSVYDDSANVFSVTNVALTNPAARLKAGDPLTVAWTHTGLTNVKIESSVLGDFSDAVTVVASTPAGAGSGNYATTVPLESTTAFKLRVSDADPPVTGPAGDRIPASDDSDSASTVYGTVTVTAPTGGSVWSAGNPQNITWTVSPANANVVRNVKITAAKNGNFNDSAGDNLVTIANSAPSHTAGAGGTGFGSFTWTPTFTGTTVRVRVAEFEDPAPLGGQNRYDTAAFIISGIAISAPVGGESWLVGSQQTILYTYTGSIANVRLEYSINNGTSWNLFPNGSIELSADGNTYSSHAGNGSSVPTSSPSGNYVRWTVPDAISPANQMMVRITDIVSAASSMTPGLTITGALAINTPATLTVGQSTTLTWTATGTINSVNIQFSPSGTFAGDIQSAVVGGTGGSAPWTVPDNIGNAGKLRIIDAVVGHPPTQADSGAFSIKGNFAFTSPTGVTQWAVRENQNVTWTNTGTMGTVRLEYATDVDNYATWTAIDNAIVNAGATGTHAWADIPDLVSLGGNNPNPPAPIANPTNGRRNVKLRLTDMSHAGAAQAQVELGSPFKVKYYLITFAVTNSDGSHLSGLNAVDSVDWNVADESLISPASTKRHYKAGSESITWSKALFSALTTNFDADADKTVQIVLDSEAPTQFDVNLFTFYNESTDKMNLSLTLTRVGSIVTSAVALGDASIVIYDTDGSTVLQTLTQAEPDVNGVYRFGPFDPDTYGLKPGSSYQAKCTIVYNNINKTSIGQITFNAADQTKTIMAALGSIADTSSSDTLFGKLASITQKTEKTQAAAELAAQRASTVAPATGGVGGGVVGAAPEISSEVLKSIAELKSMRAAAGNGGTVVPAAASPVAEIADEKAASGAAGGLGTAAERAGAIKKRMEDLLGRIRDFETLKAVQVGAFAGTEGGQLQKSIQEQVGEAEKLAKDLGIDLGTLMQMTEEQKQRMMAEQYGDVKTMKDYVVRISAVVEAVKEAAGTDKPVVKNWMENGSIILRTLAINPSKEKNQEVLIKSYLPVEARPENVLNRDELTLLFDPDKSQFYAEKKVELKPGETYALLVHIEDIWTIEDAKIQRMEDRAETALGLVQSSNTGELAKLLRDNILATLKAVQKLQRDETLLPESHIAQYRQSVKMLEECEKDLTTLESLVLKTPFGSAKSAAPSFANVSQTWKILLGIVAFLALLSLASFMVWERQIKDMVKPREINMIPPERRAEVHQTLVSHALNDRLTSLFNAGHFKTLLAHELASAGTSPDAQLSIVMMDIDFFKQVNDKYGHIAGDEVLRGVADVLRSHAGKTGTAFRYGGDEFMLLLPKTALADAAKLAEKIRKGIEGKTFVLGDHKTSSKVTVSLGAVQYGPGETAESLVSRVDKALYQSKNNGRNQVTAPVPLTA